MPELNFKITGDDSELKKTLAGIAKLAKENSDKIQKEIGSGVDAEVKSRERVVKTALKQKEIALEIVKSTEDEAKAADKVTEAIKKKNAAFDAGGKQIRPVQISNSQDEINAAKSGSVGTISTGTVVGASADFNKMASEAAGYGVAAKEAFNKAVTGSNQSTQAVQNAQKAIRSLKIDLQAYKNIAESSTDSKRLGEYNNKVRETQAEIARLRNVGKVGFDELGNKLTVTAGKQEILTNKLRIYQDALSKAKAPQSFVDLNRKIEETEIQLGKLKNAGRTGFDDMGNAVAKSTNKLGGLWNGLKTVANILPGVGIAGLLAFAAEPIINYISQLDIFKKALSQIKVNVDALNDVQKTANQEAGKQISSLKILYTAATDVTKSTQDRTAAAQELKKEFPDAFSNSKISAILNGEESKTYKQLTADILENARAKAAADKIAEVSSKRLDAEFQKQKINSAENSQLNNYAKVQKQNAINYKEGKSLLKPGSIQDLDNVQTIKDDADKARKIQDEQIKLLDGQEAFLTRYAAGGKKFASVIIGNSNQIKNPLERFDSLLEAASSKADIDNIKSALQAKLSALAPNDKQIADYHSKIKQLEEIEKRYSPKLSDGKAELATENAIKKQSEVLQAKINNINKEYSRKSSTKDDSELQAIRDRFKNIAAEAAKFNSDPKNKLHLVDTSNLEATKNQAIADLQYRQNTEKVKLELDKQKVLYAEYEDYKTSVGKEAANERFKDELNTSVTLLQKLEAERAKILDKDPTKMTGAELERLQDYDKRIDVEVRAEQKKYDALVKQFISYSDERKALIEKYQDEVAQLEAGGADTSARTLKYQEDLKSLDDANVQKLDAYKALFKGIENLSDANAKKVIENAQAMLKTLVGEGKISKEMADQISKMITETNRSLKDRLPDRLISLANQIDAVANAVSGVDEGFAKMLGTLGNVVGQVGNIKKGVKDLEGAQKSGDTLGQLGAGLGIFGAGLSILTSVSKLFDKSAQREEQAAYARDLQNKQTEAMNKALERQIQLIDEAYGTERITKYTAAIAQAEADQKKYQDQLAGRYTLTGNDKQADAMIATYNEGGSLPGMSRAFLEKTFQQSGFSQLPKDFEQLQRLFEEGKLDAQTGLIVANLIEAAQKSKELTNNLNAERIGTSLDSMADSFLDRLTKGTAEYGDFLEDIIKTSLLEGFKSQMIEKSLQPFYDKYAEFAEGGLTKDEIAQLKQLKDKIIADGEKELANLEAITGETLRDDNTSGSALQKGITQITSDQASALEGIARGSYDYLKRLFESFEKSNLSGSQQLDIAMRGLVWQQQTAENTAATVVELKSAVTELKAINKNTGGTGTSIRGAGYGPG